jgi:uncharacterized cupin superfamily protein
MSDAFAPQIRRATDADRARAAAWELWACEPSAFEWGYAATEHCLMLEGEAIVEARGQEFRFGPGDYVTFPKGLACRWRVLTAVKKHYWFED